MTQAVAIVIAVSLVVFVAAHVSLLVSLLGRPSRVRGLVALVVPPLAPYWGWREGLKLRVYVWATTLTLYTAGVALLANA
jgi:hypothetical protein